MWTAPKHAEVGDDVVIYIANFGFFATARIASEPEPRPRRRNRYGADIDSIRLIRPAVSLNAIKRYIPELTWARYPRSITTPVSDVADQIRNLVRQRRQTGLPDLDEDFLQQASLDELRKVALLASSKSLPTKRQVTLYRARSLAIRLYVLKRANGRCESCGNPGPFRTPDGSLFLEAHHIHKVADGGPDHPRKVIGVCPNCHRRAHYSVDFKKFNDVLARKLAKLEK